MSESQQSPPTLKLAVCLFNNVAATDFQGPVELFGFLSPSRLETNNPGFGMPKYAISTTYLSLIDGLITPMSGPSMMGSTTYDKVGPDEQFNIILIPGGYGVRPNVVPLSLLEFLKRQVPGADYVLSVCTGSWVLAQAGLLGGKRATTNKASFNKVKEATKEQGITWVPKARWVVDGNYWTSSGVTAGTDMASAFLEYLIGDEVASKIRGVVELSVKKEDDDEFAAFYGLI
ncbi:class I glutamine amidotransferase-like protein [Cristinia sonorae]|uniref:Class I glutamine amidotransferase-like protein n=1 Tax=Cristinia sonorae TaxID=1940300 RepID=A0A8K0UF74_9AGAR|nr:class I glutamine amidotransferase-like protein [Cristinia sonorae]